MVMEKFDFYKYFYRGKELGLEGMELVKFVENEQDEHVRLEVLEHERLEREHEEYMRKSRMKETEDMKGKLDGVEEIVNVEDVDDDGGTEDIVNVEDVDDELNVYDVTNAEDDGMDVDGDVVDAKDVNDNDDVEDEVFWGTEDVADLLEKKIEQMVDVEEGGGIEKLCLLESKLNVFNDDVANEVPVFGKICDEEGKFKFYCDWYDMDFATDNNLMDGNGFWGWEPG